MIYPNTTFSGQEITICNRYAELFLREANEHPKGIEARALILELNTIIPEAYHDHKLIWLNIKWKDVLNGNEALGFPGVNLDVRLAATTKKDETLVALREFQKYQREENHPTIKRLLHERDKAAQKCRQDTTHNPNLASFKRVGGKLTLDVPSKKPHNESTNAAFAMRAMELIPDMDNEHRTAVAEALGDANERTKKSDFWDNKLDKELVRLNVNLPEPPDPPEDFTTFIEEDPLGKVTITASTVTAISISRNERTLVHKAVNITGDFSHTFAATMSNNVAVGNCSVWALANVANDSVSLIAANEDLLAVLYSNSSYLYITESDGGTVYFDFVASLTQGVKYYHNPARDESIGSYGQFSNMVYLDVNMTNLVVSLSVLLHSSKKDFIKVFALMSYDDNQGARTLDLEVNNLDLGLVDNGIVVARSRLINLGGNLGGVTKSTLNNLGGV